MEVEWVLPQMAALSGGELPAKMEAHSSPEAEGKEDSFIPAFEFRSSSFFFFYGKLSHHFSKESGGLG